MFPVLLLRVTLLEWGLYSIRFSAPFGAARQVNSGLDCTSRIGLEPRHWQLLWTIGPCPLRSPAAPASPTVTARAVVSEPGSRISIRSYPHVACLAHGFPLKPTPPGWHGGAGWRRTELAVSPFLLDPRSPVLPVQPGPLGRDGPASAASPRGPPRLSSGGYGLLGGRVPDLGCRVLGNELLVHDGLLMVFTHSTTGGPPWTSAL